MSNSGSVTSPPPGLDGDGSSHGYGSSRRAGGHRSTSSMSGTLPPGLAGAQSPSNGGSSSSSLLTIVKAQISFLLSTLSEDNFAKNRADIAGLIDQHNPEAQYYFLRRLLLACAPTTQSTASSTNSSLSSNNKDGILSPSGANAPSPAQLPVYLRILQQEAKKLASDPLSVDEITNAFLSGLNDPSVATVDTFKNIDLPALMDKLSLTPFEKGVLLLEFVQLALPDTEYGVKSVNAAVTQKRRDYANTAIRLLSEQNVWEEFAAGVPGAELQENQLAKLAGLATSQLAFDENGEAERFFDATRKWTFPSTHHIKLLNEWIGMAAGSDERCEHVFSEATRHITLPGGDNSAVSTAVTLIDRLIQSPKSASPAVIEGILKASGFLQSNTTSTNQALSAELPAFLEDPRMQLVTGQALLAAIEQSIPEGHAAPDWSEIIKNLQIDLSRPAIPQENAGLLATFFSAESSSNSTRLVEVLFEPFPNRLLQIYLLDFLINHQYDFAVHFPTTERTISMQKLADADQSESAVVTIAEQMEQVEYLGWNHAKLVSTLLQIADDQNVQEAPFDIQAAARTLLDRGNQTAPELVFFAILKTEKPWGPTAVDLSERLLAYFVGAPQLGSAIALWGLATEDKPLLLEKLKDLYTESELNVTRIVDIAHEYKLLGDILDSESYFFALDVAALAGKKEYLYLEKWLETSTSSRGSTFVRAALEFVGHKVRHDLSRQDQDVAQSTQPTTLAIPAPIIATFLRALRSHHEIFGPDEIELFKEVRTQCLQLHPRLMNFSPGAEQEPGISVTTFTPEIESEVDAFYKRMYDQDISVENVVALLQRAKESDNVHDHDFLACFLHGLFDEYKFFATYPQQELTLTAFLFGSLIQNHLIDYIPLGIAVRYVLDALRNPPDSNWFRFGVQALSRFQPRLHEWPSLAQAILDIPHLADAHPDIANIARAALSAPEGAHENGILDDGQLGDEEAELEDENKAFTALKPDKVARRRAAPEQPPEAVSDRILFTINNLAPTNLESKVKDLDGKMEETHFRWFANYLVDQRVSIEPNNQQLYMQFLDALELKALFKEVQQETLIRAEELLNSEQTVQSSNQRTLLKNLGAWLGALTLAKNLPVKHKNVSFKDLLIEGYDSNRLIVAIPFVCKVLEQCAKSKIFKPPNPWLMAILRLLVELYQFAELKLNLKFEIEVLCKNLNIDLKEIQPTTTLRDRPPKEIAPPENGTTASQDLEKNLANGFPAAGQNGESAAQGQPGKLPAPASGLSLLGAATSSGAAGYSLALADAITAALATIPQYLSFSAQVAAFSSNATLKRLVQLGIDRAVREIVAPVVERSVTIAGISTRELTIKDFAMEGGEDRLRQAAHLMVQNLAGSLALVTCKEPLRLSIVSHIRTLMLQNGFSEQNLPEQAIVVIANDNLDLACSVVEKVAMDRAVVEVDDALGPAYMARMRHRERSNQAFWDTAAMAASHYSGMLPDPLRLKLGGLQPNQIKVYEDFGRRALSTYLQPEQPAAEEASTQAGAGATAANYEGQGPGGLLTAQQSSDIFTQLMTDLDKALASAEASGLNTATVVPPNHEIHMVLRQLPVVAARSFGKDETTLGFSQKVVQLLYRSETTLAREVYVVLLQRLCDVATKVAKEVTAWLIYAPDERKFNTQVTVLLLESGFISVSEYDAQLAKFIMREFRPSVVNFAAQLARECLLNERPIASREHFSHSLRALAQAVQSGKGGEIAPALLDDLRSSASLDAANRSQLDDRAVREQLTMCFVEWVRIYQQSYQIEKAFVEFVVQLQNQGILKGEEISSLFFRVCAEVSVESYIKQKAAGGTVASGIFQPVDAFAKLITFMIKYHADPQNKNNDQAKVHYMTKVLSIVVLVLAQSHEELGTHFQQKPFYRFFSTLLSNLNSIEVHLGSAYYQILTALSHSVNTLQPLFFSGFTFSWMALVSHRLFMPKLLNMKDREGWSSFHRLLISLMRFLAPFLKKEGGQADEVQAMTETTRAIYTGTLRIILVLLHDFPEFLTVYYYSLADAIPTSCIQLHNLISSAFPLSTRLPDPLLIKSGTEVPEANVPPTLLSDFTAALQPADLRTHLEKSLQKTVERGAATGLKERLFLADNKQANNQDTNYNVPLINSIVMFAGYVALAQSKAQNGNQSFQASAPSVAFLQNLVEELEPEGSYLVLSAVSTHLRYPNSHSTWFSSWLIHTFSDSSSSTSEYIKEQIVRVLLEKLVAHRPHPFSVISTFVQLLKEESFFKHSFITKSPEVQLLLNNIRSSLAITSA